MKSSELKECAITACNLVSYVLAREWSYGRLTSTYCFMVINDTKTAIVNQFQSSGLHVTHCFKATYVMIIFAPYGVVNIVII